MAKKKTQKAKERPAQRGAVKMSRPGKIKIEPVYEEADWVARLRTPDGKEIVWLPQPDGSVLAHLVAPTGLVPLPELGVPDSLEHLQQIVATLLAEKEV